MPIDLSLLPDKAEKEQGINLALLPDKSPDIDLSALPDQAPAPIGLPKPRQITPGQVDVTGMWDEGPTGKVIRGGELVPREAPLPPPPEGFQIERITEKLPAPVGKVFEDAYSTEIGAVLAGGLSALGIETPEDMGAQTPAGTKEAGMIAVYSAGLGVWRTLATKGAARVFGPRFARLIGAGVSATGFPTQRAITRAIQTGEKPDAKRAATEAVIIGSIDAITYGLARPAVGAKAQAIGRRAGRVVRKIFRRATGREFPAGFRKWGEYVKNNPDIAPKLQVELSALTKAERAAYEMGIRRGIGGTAKQARAATDIATTHPLGAEVVPAAGPPPVAPVRPIPTGVVPGALVPPSTAPPTALPAQVAPGAITPVVTPTPEAIVPPAPIPAPAFVPQRPAPPVERGPGFEADMAEIRAAQDREAARIAEIQERAAVREEAVEVPVEGKVIADPIEPAIQAVARGERDLTLQSADVISLFEPLPENLTRQKVNPNADVVYRTTDKARLKKTVDGLIATYQEKPLDHAKIGRLLGYSEEDIAFFIAKQAPPTKPTPPPEAPPKLAPLTEAEKAIMAEEAGIRAPVEGSPLIDTLRKLGIRISLADIKRVTGLGWKDIPTKFRMLLRKTKIKGVRARGVEELDRLAERVLEAGGDIHSELGGIYNLDPNMRPEDQLIEILTEEAIRPSIEKVEKPSRARPLAFERPIEKLLPMEPPRPGETAQAFRARMKAKRQPGESPGAFRARMRARRFPIRPGETAEAFYERIMKVTPPTARAVGVTPDLITSGQEKQILAAATEKLLISEKGKPTPGYRRSLKAMTGRKYTKDLTEVEAEIFIDALKRLPEPTIGLRGKRKPPTIPITTVVAAPGEFEVEYKEPTAFSLRQAPERYAYKLGVKSLVEPAEIGYTNKNLEYQKISNAIDRQIKELHKVTGTTLKERIKAKLQNKPTRAMRKMRNALNMNEEVPDHYEMDPREKESPDYLELTKEELARPLSKEEKEIFTWFRNLTRTTWQRENEVRKTLGIEPIKYRHAYIRHVAKGIVQEMLAGRYPFPEGKLFQAQQIIAKKTFNAMEMPREYLTNVERLFSRDPAFAAKSMMWTALKEIHLSKPLSFLQAQMNARGKDLPVYKNLTPEEQRRFNKIMVMPASVRKWTNDYVNVTIKGQQSFTDQRIENIVKATGLKGIINSVIGGKWKIGGREFSFGRALSHKPVANFFSRLGRGQMLGVMGGLPIPKIGGRPRQIIRNKFQRLQDLAFRDISAVIRGFFPAHGELQKFLDGSLFLKAYTGVEEWPVAAMGKVSKAAMDGFQWSAVSNARQSMKTGWWHMQKYYKPKMKKYGWDHPKYKEKWLREEVEATTRSAQYNYTAIGMPEIFRHKTLTPLTRLQSWWINHIAFHEDALYRFLHGRPMWARRYNKPPKWTWEGFKRPWTVGEGPTLSWSDRIGWFRYLVIGGFVLNSLNYGRSYLFGVAPTGLPPMMQFIWGAYAYVVGRGAGDERLRKRGKKIMQSSGKTFIPLYLAAKDWHAFLSAITSDEPVKAVKEMFFYKKWKKGKSWTDGWDMKGVDTDLEDIDLDMDFEDLDFEDIDLDID